MPGMYERTVIQNAGESINFYYYLKKKNIII